MSDEVASPLNSWFLGLQAKPGGKLESPGGAIRQAKILVPVLAQISLEAPAVWVEDRGGTEGRLAGCRSNRPCAEQLQSQVHTADRAPNTGALPAPQLHMSPVLMALITRLIFTKRPFCGSN